MICVIIPKEHSTDQDYCNRVQDFMFSQGYKWAYSDYEHHSCVVAYFASQGYLTHWSQSDIVDYDGSLERCLKHAKRYGYKIVPNPLEPTYSIDLESVA